jgi:hypothetical protein
MLRNPARHAIILHKTPSKRKKTTATQHKSPLPTLRAPFIIHHLSFILARNLDFKLPPLLPSFQQPVGA